MGTAKAVRRLWSSTAPDLSPLAGGTRHGFGGLSPEQPGCQGGWEGQGRRKESGPPPPRPSGCPPRLPRARRSRRPEEREAEERSELSPGALRDRVPGGGGGGSAPAGEWARAAGADSFHLLQPENGPQEVLLVPKNTCLRREESSVSICPLKGVFFTEVGFR
ncbi:guanine nucleotide-binding protein G(I)/G(S)/G(O) subunit gamma-12 isoform X2 [Mustela lutreola]|uniref:guanine nucleotide-binding protein G(I)/G(S)/G(O) subunit gamma-12 isoform X2 n=1 Tax=Mustela lutreola TaxID=9666 RepID=UPI002796EB84|nr:guanine nucleotide-binding protein G(I)/G(S)/G(O) subunit gamma-12 isoform X2 [Mustela lutreola]